MSDVNHVIYMYFSCFLEIPNRFPLELKYIEKELCYNF